MTLSLNGLERRLEKVKTQVEKQFKGDSIIRTCWGHEQVELEPGERLIVTHWGSRADVTEEDDAP